jgi:hypothetical protein
MLLYEGGEIMVRKIIEIADSCGLTGMKRVMFYIVAPFIAAVSYIVGFVKGWYESINL